MKFPLFLGLDSDLHLLHGSRFPSLQTHMSLRPLIRPCPMKSRPGLSQLGHRGCLLAVPTGRQCLWTDFGSRELCCWQCSGIPASPPLWKEACSREEQGTCLGRCPVRKWWGPVGGCGQGQRPGQAQRAASSAGNNRRSPRLPRAVPPPRSRTGARSQPPASPSGSTRLLRRLLGLAARCPPHLFSLHTRLRKAQGHVPLRPKNGSQTGRGRG